MTSRIKRMLLLVPLAIVAVGLLLVAVLWLFDKREDYAFQRIAMHAPESIVIALMGAPDTTEPCGEELWWGGDADSRGMNDGRCVQQSRYRHLFNTWIVGYSQDRHVVSKHHPSSK